MIRTRAKNPLFVFGVSAGLFLASTSLQAKEPELYFYPVKSWAVDSSATSEISTESGLNCSIHNEFNNGFALELGGSEKWVELMSVDFRQEAFESGKIYNVSLAVPGIEAVKIEGKADSSGKIMIDMRRQKDFYQAMREAAVLDLGIDQNNFRFYLVGFSSAAKGFERCMAGGPIQAPEDAVKEASAEPMSSSDMTLNESIALEKKETEQLGVTEILPEDPEVIVQDIPQTTAVKLEDAPAPEEVFSEEMTMDSVAPEPVAAQALPGSETATEEMPQRLSEQLAAEIEQNPEIIAVDDAPEQPKLTARQERYRRMAQQQLGEELSPPEPAMASLAEPPAPSETPALDGQVVITEETASVAAMMANEPADAPVAADPEADIAAAAGLAAEEPEAAQAVEPEAVIEEPVAEEKPPAPRVRVELPPKREMKITKETAKIDADFTELDAVEPASAPQVEGERFPDSGVNEGLGQKISELESLVARLERENVALNEELKSSLKESEDERLSISSENWNLERATMRFNEAERQIKRLGQQLEGERAKCEMERKDLETQLFDPQITGQQQLARLAELEQQIADQQQKLEDQRRHYEERIKILEEQAGSM